MVLILLTTISLVLFLDIFTIRHESSTVNHEFISGGWRETLVELGIPQFPDTLSPDALAHHEPDIINLRFDTQKRKRAFAMPRCSNMFLSEDIVEQNPQSRSAILRKELQAFKKIEEEGIHAGRRTKTGSPRNH
jgi:hypothetical protein